MFPKQAPGRVPSPPDQLTPETTPRAPRSAISLALNPCARSTETVSAPASGDVARWHMDAAGLVAFAYLTLFSSCLAYTAYGWLSRNTRPALIGTYSYVNPLIAAFFGWEFLDERLSATQIAGMLIVIVGVLFVTLPATLHGATENAEAPPTGA